MLTHGPAPDPKCKLNISSFLIFPHLSDCLTCTRNSVSIVLLLSMIGEWDGWGMVASYQGLGGDRGWVLSLSLFFVFVFICAFVFWSLMSSLFFK